MLIGIKRTFSKDPTLLQSRPNPSEDDLTTALRLLRRVGDVVEDSANGREAVERILGALCAHLDWPIGHVYEAVGGQYASMGLWYLGEGVSLTSMTEFMEQSEGTIFALGQGLIGGVAQSGRATCVRDVTRKDGYLRARGAERNGLRGCVAFPVRVNGSVVRVVELFSRDEARLDDRMVELLGFVGAQIARSVERDRAREERQRLAGEFEGRVTSLVQVMGRTVSQLGGIVAEMDEANGRARQRGEEIDQAVTESRDRIEHVARSMVPLAEALTAMGEDARSNDRAADRLGRDASALRADFTDLGERAGNAERVLQAIGDIAARIKLLGLNASIEAARVGEMGRGFAIVAREVKTLAAEAERATGEITQWMTGLTRAIGDAAITVEDFAASMGDLRDTAHATLERTTAQLASCRRVSEELDAAVTRSHGARDRVDHIQEAIHHCRAVTRSVEEVSLSLDGQGQDLRHRVDAFVEDVLRL